MRILYLTNGFPFPLTSGYLRHFFLIKELSTRHRITLLSIVGASFKSEHVSGLAPFTERVMTFAASGAASLPGKVLGRVRSLAGLERAAREMCGAIESLMREQCFDVALFSGKRTFPAVRHLKGLPIVVDLCDATSTGVRRSIRYRGPARVPVSLIDYLQLRIVERMLMRNAAHLLFASCRDREALLGHSRDRATVVPNGIDLDFWKRSTSERGSNTIIFTGGMHYAPNLDAALCLIEEVMPLVQRSISNARLLIVGREPPTRLIEAGRRSGVTVTGFVDDVRPYMEQATVFAAPLRFGAGIQNKLLDAMAMEIPVIASPLAADGLRTEEGERPPLQIAHDRREFADMICRQLLGSTNPATLASAGRQFVGRHFDWRCSGEKLERVINAVSSPAMAGSANG